MELEGRDPIVRKAVARFEAASAAKRRGRTGAAATSLRKMISLAGKVDGPDRLSLESVALHQLADVAGGDLLATEIERALELAALTEQGGPAGWTVRFALGDAFRRRDPRAAMAWYDAANLMRRSALTYSADRMDQLAERLIKVFDRSTVARLSRSGSPSEKPVFIVGLPRSGTTLVERILAGLPGVEAGGELRAMPEVCRQIHGLKGGWPEAASNLTSDQIAHLGAGYLRTLEGVASAARRVTDKMPANIQNIGLILGMFPGATIIHVRRDPLDACFGCYRQLFGGNVDYAYDQTELARYWRAIDRLARHWSELAPDQYVEVEYETLASDPEAESRHLAEAIGVTWTEDCLNVARRSGVIDTASALQARQPISSRNIGASEPFLPYLGELRRALSV